MRMENRFSRLRGASIRCASVVLAFTFCASALAADPSKNVVLPAQPRRVMKTAGVIARQLAHGQTNFLNSLFHIERVFRPDLLLADHALPVHYEIPLPQPTAAPAKHSLYIHPPRGRKGRAIDAATERFVDATRMGATP